MSVSKTIQDTLNRTRLCEVKPNNDMVDAALSFNVRDLDVIPETDLTKMIVGISQYIIYITLEINKLRVQKVVIERNIDVAVAVFVASNNVKGTKVEKKMMAIGSSVDLMNKEEKLNNLLIELSLLYNIDKYLEFYCNALKKELARRERELNFKSR